jgi:peptide/nickel transport system ATP-binding protein/oligopeptide transport system ATP-binding protein
MALLEASALTKRYPLGRNRGWLTAVDAVDLDVDKGEVLGIVGESGSGKTTLSRMIVQLVAPTSGRLVFDGIDVARAGRAERAQLRRRIQIIFQDPQSSLDPRMRLDAIVAEGLYYSKLSQSARGRRVGELLEMVGLHAGMLRNYPHQLSGGERQRVGIARALACEPELLIADEPVSALDASVQGQVLNLLRNLQRKHGMAMLFIAHELPVARYMSDRIAVMQTGRIVELRPADALFEAPEDPYTRALLDAMPSYGRRGRDELAEQAARWQAAGGAA